MKKPETVETRAAKIAKEKPCEQCVYFRENYAFGCIKDCDFEHSCFKKRKYIKTLDELLA